MVGLPLGDPSMRTPASIMYNILGEDDVMDVFALLYCLKCLVNSTPLHYLLISLIKHAVAFWFQFTNFREKLVSNWLIGSLQGLCVFQVHLFIGMTSQVRFLFSYSFLVVCCQF